MKIKQAVEQAANPRDRKLQEVLRKLPDDEVFTQAALAKRAGEAVSNGGYRDRLRRCLDYQTMATWSGRSLLIGSPKATAAFRDLLDKKGQPWRPYSHPL